MKTIFSILLILFSLSIGCEEIDDSDEQNDVESENGIELINDDRILIRTGKDVYSMNSDIDISYCNNIATEFYGFTCNLEDTKPSRILRRENGIWKEHPFTYVCLWDKPAFYKPYDTATTVFDTILLPDMAGDIIIRYRFIIENDTSYFDSNRTKIETKRH